MQVTLAALGGGTPETMTAGCTAALEQAGCVIGAKRLLEQLYHFPMGAHDDGPDALEGARTIAKKTKRFRILDRRDLGL